MNPINLDSEQYMEMIKYLFSSFLIKNVCFELEKPDALSKHIYSLVPTKKYQKIHYTVSNMTVITIRIKQ